MGCFCRKMCPSYAFCQNFSFTAHVLPYPRQTLFFLSFVPSYVRDGFLSPPIPLACLLLAVASCSPQAGLERGSEYHGGVTGYLPVTQALLEMVLWWSWSGSQLNTRPCTEGLDKEKSQIRALCQHLLPLIKGHFRVKSKSNEIRLL